MNNVIKKTTNNKLHTPDGVKDSLPEELSMQTEIINRIETVMKSYNYAQIKSPMFEYMDVFSDTMGFNPTNAYKFVDTDGNVLALRPDMTPPIARICATKYKKEDIPIRLCYFENSFRNDEAYQGKQKEFSQAGIELIGAGSCEATAEVIAVSINSLINTGLEDFRIEIGTVSFIKRILSDSGLCSQTADEISEYILQKDFVAVNHAVKKAVDMAHLDPAYIELFKELPFLSGGREIIYKAMELLNDKNGLSGLDELILIADILDDYGMDKYYSFDLSMLGQLDYYTGVIFRGYAAGTGYTIMDGGRYDSLLSKFGADYPAVGFAIDINNLFMILMKKGNPFKKNCDTYVAFSDKARKTALCTADELRMSGVNVENSVIGMDYEQNEQYAKQKGFGGMLYFTDEDSVILHDFENDEKRTVSIESILNKGGDE